MWTIDHHVGRLIELRVRSPVLMSELEPFGARLAGFMAELHRRGQRTIGCVDLQDANLFAPEVAEWFIAQLQRDNALLERSALLIGSSAMFALQIERILKQANNPSRRTFRDIEHLAAWLGEVMTSAELQRLRQFLVER